MSDVSHPSRSLSEIGHLFLSSVRERQTQGAPRPKRQPPAARPQVSIALTPDELAEVWGSAAETRKTLPGEEGHRLPPVTAIISAHLGGKQLDRAREYARH